jgi:hypothetical protein
MMVTRRVFDQCTHDILELSDADRVLRDAGLEWRRMLGDFHQCLLAGRVVRNLVVKVEPTKPAIRSMQLDSSCVSLRSERRP